MNKDIFWMEYRKINESELSSWVEGLSPVEKKNIEDRVSQLTMEISHGRYYDGWTLEGMKEEREKLSKLLSENI
tara:strand:- start:1692 stop:1913 length:222 start_codon:yes stop_codon:yes gene_type:complete